MNKIAPGSSGRAAAALSPEQEFPVKNKPLNSQNRLFVSDTHKPKYGRIQDSILARIEKGDWEPGDRVPTERELARMYEASIGTVRNALQNLVNQGYLSRRQGRGTFVKKSVEHTDSLRYFRFAADFEDVVQPLRIECLHMPRLTRSPEVAAILNLDSGSDFFKIDRRFCLGTKPMVYVTTYLPRGLFKDFGALVPQVLEEIPLYLLVESKYHMPTLALKERFSAVTADDTVAKMLDLAAGTPVQKIMMVAFTSRNTAYEYQVSYCDTTDKQIFRG